MPDNTSIDEFMDFWNAKLDSTDSKALYEWKSESEKTFAFEQYRAIIRDEHQTSIEQIARIVDKPVPIVFKEIQSMIDEKYMIDIYIDSASKSIMFGVNPNPKATSIWPFKKAPANVVCKNCGANNPIANRNCEYCGSLLLKK